MGKTTISWTDHSINPIRARLNGRTGHYCEKVSQGCKNCYSSRLQSRFGMPEFQEQRRADVEVFLDGSKLLEVLRRRAPTKYFWCDMTDIFGAWVTDEWLDLCFAVMALTPRHTHQLLTKRPERMRSYTTIPGRHNNIELAADLLRPGKGQAAFGGKHMLRSLPFKNVWLGVSVEDQATADERIPLLLQTPAAVRFVSYEPGLAGIDFDPFLWRPMSLAEIPGSALNDGCSAGVARRQPGLGWIIVGGESGRHARPFNVAWARAVIRQCRAAGVACFVKQLGAAPEAGLPNAPLRMMSLGLRDRKGGDIEEWPEDLRVRQFPEARS